MKTLKKSITLLTAALAVAAVTACPISAQTDVSTEPVKTYKYNFDTLKSLTLKCGLDYDVNVDEENGTITFSSKDGNIYGNFVVSYSSNGKTNVFPANVSIEDGAADAEYSITVCTDIEIGE